MTAPFDIDHIARTLADHMAKSKDLRLETFITTTSVVTAAAALRMGGVCGMRTDAMLAALVTAVGNGALLSIQGATGKPPSLALASDTIRKLGQALISRADGMTQSVLDAGVALTEEVRTLASAGFDEQHDVERLEREIEAKGDELPPCRPAGATLQ